MRRVLLLSSALLLVAPASLLFGANDAWAKGRADRRPAQGRPSRKPKPAPKKPDIKLKEVPATPDAAAPQTSAPPQRGPTRIDFDDRLVQGQTNKSGSVYLYDRKELKTRSMVKKRESFRSEIVEAVYDSE